MKQDPPNPPHATLDALTAAATCGTHWRSLEELAVQAGIAAPEHVPEEEASEMLDPASRRRFLQLAAASFGVAGLSGCTRQPVETIVPYVDQPESIVPGNPQYHATAVPVAGMAQGVLVESHMGRSTKVDGNPLHPASLGATSVHA